MPGRLAREIQQNKPFSSLEQEAFLNIGRTWDALLQRECTLLKDYGLTPTQYNILRILRGAGRAGMPCSQAAERMITHDSDITRLLDRLEARGLTERERSREDRRVVVTRITENGRKLVDSLDGPVSAMLKALLGRLGKEKLERLIELLETLRGDE